VRDRGDLLAQLVDCRPFWPVVTPFDLRSALVGHKTKVRAFFWFWPSL